MEKTTVTSFERLDDDPVAGQGWVTKDSGEREEYVSGMRRDTQNGKPRFDLLLTDMPYQDQFLTRLASLLDRGAAKYGERNWQLASSNEELARFKASALRHLMQWASGERDEDHAAAVAFNLMAYEYVQWKLEQSTEEGYKELAQASEETRYVCKLHRSCGDPSKCFWGLPRI